MVERRLKEECRGGSLKGRNNVVERRLKEEYRGGSLKGKNNVV